MNFLSKLLVISVLAVSLMSAQARAAPWCHGGTIVTLYEKQMSGESVQAHFDSLDQLPPQGNQLYDFYVAQTVANSLTQMHYSDPINFAWAVPHDGQVDWHKTAPQAWIDQYSSFSIWDGISFVIRKCYTYPPMSVVKDPVPVAGGSGSNWPNFEPLPDTRGLKKYWQKPNRDSNAKLR